MGVLDRPPAERTPPSLATTEHLQGKGRTMNAIPTPRELKAMKDKHPTTLLLVRCGDFYEMFDDDAKIAADELGLAVTSRGDGEDAMLLTGVPYHAVDAYIARLVRAGHRVALCERVA